MKLGTSKEQAPRWIWPAAGCALLLLAALLVPSSKTQRPAGPAPPPTAAAPSNAFMDRLAAAQARKANSSRTAGEIVAAKLKKFAARRRALVHKLAERYKVAVLPEVERFFDALDAGNWDEVKDLFHTLRAEFDGPSGPDLRTYWRAIVEAYGAAEQVQMWPPQQLLDYGNGILNSLKPGMIYVGGTDAGCFICTMLNETSDGEQHVTLTQNALADSSYIDYLSAIYGDSLNIPTQQDETNAFNQYVADATARAQHDEQFPNEPKQVLPGENTTLTDGHASVSGQVAVMDINNILMQNLLQNNPGLSFAMEESFPLPSTYTGATPLGPVFQLRADDAMTADDAAQAVNYWQTEAQNLQDGDETSEPALRSFAHDAAAQGNLLANNNFPAQAGQAYQTALDMWPADTEAITGLTRALAQQGQIDQAGQALDTFLQNNPQQSQTVSNLRQSLAGRH